jgi:HAD superfamily hydrolase (TIGR01549 family)
MILKACFFDLYETLITEQENEMNIIEYGTPENKTPASYLGISEESFEKEWVARRPGRMKGVFTDYYSVIKDICTQLNLDIDDKILTSLNEKRLAEKRKPYQNINGEIVDMLKELKRMGLKIGLVSNCSGEETEGLFLSPLSNLFDEIILSYQVGVSKPDKEIYDAACQRLGVNPGEAIFIGDGGANELMGAKKAGMKAFRASWFYDRNLEEQEFPVVSKPKDVLRIIM